MLGRLLRLQKRHGELLELTISDHDQQIKELVDSLKAHAAKVEQSARDRVKQVCIVLV